MLKARARGAQLFLPGSRMTARLRSTPEGISCDALMIGNNCWIPDPILERLDWCGNLPRDTDAEPGYIKDKRSKYSIASTQVPEYKQGRKIPQILQKDVTTKPVSLIGPLFLSIRVAMSHWSLLPYITAACFISHTTGYVVSILQHRSMSLAGNRLR